MNNPVDLVIGSEIKFDYKPDPIPYQCRLSYKMTIIALLIGCTSSGRGGVSLSKIHLISTYMYSEKERDSLLNYLERKSGSYVMLRYDPLVNKVMEFLIADKITYQQKNGYFRLTEKGKAYVDKVIKENDLLVEEKEFINKIGKNLPESQIKKIEGALMAQC